MTRQMVSFFCLSDYQAFDFSFFPLSFLFLSSLLYVILITITAIFYKRIVNEVKNSKDNLEKGKMNFRIHQV